MDADSLYKGLIGACVVGCIGALTFTYLIMDDSPSKFDDVSDVDYEVVGAVDLHRAGHKTSIIIVPIDGVEYVVVRTPKSVAITPKVDSN